MKAFVSFAAFFIGFSAFATPVTAVIRLNGKVSMEELAKDVQNPASPRFGKFYTPLELRAISAPSAQEYNQILAQLRSEGFTIVAESPTHLWLSVRSEAPNFEKTFSTILKPASNGVRHQMSHIQIPGPLSQIAAVVGLDNSRKAKPKFKIASQPTLVPGGIPPSTIKSAYKFDNIYSQGITGRGQHIAIATYMGFNIDDVRTFYTSLNLNPVPSVDQIMFNGKPTFDQNSATETELDAEFSGMIAPGASVHVFASATNDDAGEAQMFTAILDDNRAKIANYSWGDCETHVVSQHKDEMGIIFARAVAQGVNVLIASGDSGSDSCDDSTTTADWPAANENIVAVGGTTFAYKGSVIGETAWTGSGGGISALFALPDWQKPLGAPFLMRSYPDVSFNADPRTGQAIWVTQGFGRAGWMVVGGTSMAAPQWSGYLALVGEARANLKMQPVGFLPPKLYQATPAEQSTLFNDVTQGSNGAYAASAGWDAVTGWGSMQGDSLLSFLTR